MGKVLKTVQFAVFNAGTDWQRYVAIWPIYLADLLPPSTSLEAEPPCHERLPYTTECGLVLPEIPKFERQVHKTIHFAVYEALEPIGKGT